LGGEEEKKKGGGVVGTRKGETIAKDKRNLAVEQSERGSGLMAAGNSAARRLDGKYWYMEIHS
jgi:hypothetical protein